MTSQKKRRNYSAQADTLFGKIVRSRGHCEFCGGLDHLQCAHGFSRRYRNVRWDSRNAFCLCAACHLFFTHRPLEWDTHLRREWGEDLYADMRALALSTEKVDPKAVLESLREQYAALEAA